MRVWWLTASVIGDLRQAPVPEDINWVKKILLGWWWKNHQSHQYKTQRSGNKDFRCFPEYL